MGLQALIADTEAEIKKLLQAGEHDLSTILAAFHTKAKGLEETAGDKAAADVAKAATEVQDGVQEAAAAVEKAVDPDKAAEAAETTASPK